MGAQGLPHIHQTTHTFADSRRCQGGSASPNHVWRVARLSGAKIGGFWIDIQVKGQERPGRILLDDANVMSEGASSNSSCCYQGL